MILAGDVGGSKCNLALVDPRDHAFHVVALRRYATTEYQHFEDMVALFLRDTQQIVAASPAGRIQAAGFGVAGPVIDDRARLTNLAWSVEAAALRQQLGTPHIVLLNDLEATGYSLSWLDPNDLCTLNAGTPMRQAAQGLIAAGTGLGEAILHWSDDRYIVAPSEGGHCDFAPRTEKEIELLRYMKKTNEHVSFEMILSGRGFLTIHQFLDPRVQHPSFDRLDADPAPEISRLGLQGSCPVCVETLDMWTAIYGAEAGNLALKALARGGMFIGGGIVAKILPKMKDGTFFRAFCEKSKFADLLAQVPIKMVLDEQAPLLGAAVEAAKFAGDKFKYKEGPGCG